MRAKTLVIGLIGVAIGVALTSAVGVLAGNPVEPPGPPASTSSYTLDSIYSRLSTGAAGTQSTFTEPSTAPGIGTMHTLDVVMAQAPAADNANGATTAEVLKGKTFWGLRTDGAWGVKTGAGNPAPVAKTGQTTCYDAGGNPISCSDTGQDGEYQKGVAWPNPRFTDNSNGTVTDNLTGLIWLRDASCLGGLPGSPAGRASWADALYLANTLQSPNPDCGLSDGSIAGQWRLPNVRELTSLVDYGRKDPALPVGHPFAGVQQNLYSYVVYWTSTDYAYLNYYSWTVSFFEGYAVPQTKISNAYPSAVWPVRDAQ